MIKFKRLSHRILFVFAVAVLAVMVLSGLAMTALAQRIVTNNIIDGQRELAGSLSNQILFELENSLQELGELTGTSSIRQMAPESTTNELRLFQSDNPAVTNLYVADVTGRQIARSDFSPMSDISSMAGFKEALEGMIYFSDLSPVVLSLQDEESPYISSATRWRDCIVTGVFVPVMNDGKVTGVLGANVHLFHIQPLIENLTFSHDETVMVLSRSGEVVAWSRREERGNLPELNIPGSAGILETDGPGISDSYKDETGQTVKALFYPIGNQGWSIVVQTPVSGFSGEVRGLWLLMILVVVGGVAIAVAIAWFVAGRLTRPITELVRATEQVAAGELTAHVETDAPDEVGRLAGSFNRMVSELSYMRTRNQHLLDELKQLNDELEKRVEQRTDELKTARDKADAASRAKSGFMANLSRELRIPLTSISGFSETLREKYFGELNEKQLEYIEYITDNSQQMTSLINRIIDLEKIETGNMEMDISTLDINGLLEKSISMVENAAAGKRIKLESGISPEIQGVETHADESKLRQVILNLLLNAVEFTPDGGRISVTVTLDDGSLVFEVADTGIGIAAEEQEKIFEDFYQAGSRVKDSTRGLGLGLGLSRRLVEMHGGKIWVESEGADKGSRFIFTVPLQ